MKCPLIMFTLLLALTSSAQINPCGTNGCPPCTNCPAYTNPPWEIPEGSLHVYLKGSTQIGATNFVAHHLYALQESSNLLFWISTLPEFTNAINLERVWNYTNTGDAKWFRIAETTYETEWIQPISGSPGTLCPGTFVAHALFYGYGTNWGVPIKTNTTLHTITYTGTNLNVRLEVTGRHGDFYCFTNSGAVSGASAMYRTIVFYPSPPNTNATDTLSYGGFG